MTYKYVKFFRVWVTPDPEGKQTRLFNEYNYQNIAEDIAEILRQHYGKDRVKIEIKKRRVNV